MSIIVKRERLQGLKVDYNHTKGDTRDHPEVVVSMKPAGWIYPGLVEETVKWGDRLIKTGRMVPGLLVQRGGTFRYDKETNTLVHTGGKIEPLSVACERAAKEVDKRLREKGYLPRMPQSPGATQGRG